MDRRRKVELFEEIRRGYAAGETVQGLANKHGVHRDTLRLDSSLGRWSIVDRNRRPSLDFRRCQRESRKCWYPKYSPCWGNLSAFCTHEGFAIGLCWRQCLRGGRACTTFVRRYMDTISNPKSIRAVAATGNLSTGFLDETLSRAVRQGADFIGCDAGSSDSGPYYLGSGKPRGATDVTKRYTGSILREAVKAKIPVILGSVGHAGTRPHLHWMLDLVRELARENGWHFSLAGIDSEIDKEKLIKAFKVGQITPLDPAPIMDENTIASAERFTAMMGIEPIQRALKAGAQIVVCGRASDVAIYAALPVLHGISPGIAFHAGKILECAAASVTQRLYPDCLSAVLDDQGFTVEPPNPAMRCTPQSVASHTLYENGDPFSLVESGGTLDTSEARYSAVSGRLKPAGRSAVTYILVHERAKGLIRT